MALVTERHQEPREVHLLKISNEGGPESRKRPLQPRKEAHTLEPGTIAEAMAVWVFPEAKEAESQGLLP